jgi:hypothetical protein
MGLKYKGGYFTTKKSDVIINVLYVATQYKFMCVYSYAGAYS